MQNKIYAFMLRQICNNIITKFVESRNVYFI